MWHWQRGGSPVGRCPRPHGGVIETGALLDAAAYPALVSQLKTNAIGPLQLTTILAPQLPARARTVFVNSSQGLRAGRDSGAYAVSKQALRAIADSLRTELARDAVGVTSIYLGRTATRMQERLYAERHEDYRPELLIQPESVTELVAAILTLPDDVEVTDISMRHWVTSY
jgi:NADP-dependent 3-hydroxy acid dehydrogenase YdfG